MTTKFKAGDRVRINKHAYDEKLHGVTGTIEGAGYGGFALMMDQEVSGWLSKRINLDGRKLDPIETSPPSLASTLQLPPQGRVVLNHMSKQGSISAADAMLSYGMTSAVLTRRVCDIENIGYVVTRESKKHPTTGRRYTRYSLAA